jgi:hypothetical protein
MRWSILLAGEARAEHIHACKGRFLRKRASTDHPDKTAHPQKK